MVHHALTQDDEDEQEVPWSKEGIEIMVHTILSFAEFTSDLTVLPGTIPPRSTSMGYD